MKFIHIIILFIAFLSIMVLQPQTSMANIINLTSTTNITSDPNNIDTYTCEAPKVDGARITFTENLVECFEGPIRIALISPGGALDIIVGYMIFSMAAFFTVAIVVLGFQMLGNHTNMLTRAFSLLLRIGIIMMVFFEIDDFANYIFDIFDMLILLVTPAGFSPWVQIDGFLGTLLGFPSYSCTVILGINICTETTGIKEGIIGLLNGSIFAKNLGIMLSIIGFIAILNILSFIIQCVYLYISSIVALAFLMIILPLIIPFILFDFSKQFIQKWLNILIATMLTPMLLFSLLSLFLGHPAMTRLDPPTGLSINPTVVAVPANSGVFIDIIDNIFARLGTDYLQSSLFLNQPLSRSMQVSTDRNSHDSFACIDNPLGITCPDATRNTSAIQSFVNPSMFSSLNNIPVVADKIDLGINDQADKKYIMLQLIMLILYTILLNALLSKVPEIAMNIANGRSVEVGHVSHAIQKVFGAIKNL